MSGSNGAGQMSYFSKEVSQRQEIYFLSSSSIRWVSYTWGPQGGMQEQYSSMVSYLSLSVLAYRPKCLENREKISCFQCRKFKFSVLFYFIFLMPWKFILISSWSNSFLHQHVPTQFEKNYSERVQPVSNRKKGGRGG